MGFIPIKHTVQTYCVFKHKCIWRKHLPKTTYGFKTTRGYQFKMFLQPFLQWSVHLASQGGVCPGVCQHAAEALLLTQYKCNIEDSDPLGYEWEEQRQICRTHNIFVWGSSKNVFCITFGDCTLSSFLIKIKAVFFYIEETRRLKVNIKSLTAN